MFGGALLRWTYYGDLAPDEFFDIKIKPVGSNDSVFVDWSKTPEYDLRPWSGWTPGLYTWQIGIIKGYLEGETKHFIADTGRGQDTGEMVAQVAALRGREPSRVDGLLARMADLVRAAVPVLQEGRLAELGRIMDENQRILQALGVSSPELEGLIDAARRAGALGAKLTGAGGGGCLIALAPEGGLGVVREALEAAGAVRVIPARPISGEEQG